MSIERFKEAVRIIEARHDSGHSNVAHNPLYIASTSNGDGELHLDDMREVLAEVERLTREKAEDQRIIGGWSEQNQRLREALRSYGAHAPDCGDAHGCTCGYSAALAGAPSETRREQARAFFAGMAQHEGAGSALACDDRRALAERVREACAEADDFNADAADGLRCAIRALDLDALLEEP